jgi:hypothetical protein
MWCALRVMHFLWMNSFKGNFMKPFIETNIYIGKIKKKLPYKFFWELDIIPFISFKVNRFSLQILCKKLINTKKNILLFVGYLCVSSSEYIEFTCRMNNEQWIINYLEGGRSWPNLNYYPKFFLDKSKNTLRSIIQSVSRPRFKQ